MREVGGGLAQFALRVQHSAEIVVDLRMIRLEQQQALVDARGLFGLVLPLGGFRLDEQSGGGSAGEAGAMAAARWALLERGAALLSVHPLRLLMCRSWSSRLTEERRFYTHFRYRSCGRVAEGGGLLNRYTLQRRIEGSNRFGSALLLRSDALRRTSAGPEREAGCPSKL